MNLALITQDFPPKIGGIETYAAELAKRYWEAFDDFLLIAPDKNGAQKVDNQLPYKVYRLKSSSSYLGAIGMFDAVPILDKKNINATFHTQWQTLPISIFAKNRGILDKIYVAAHGRELLFNPFSSNPFLKKKFENYKRWLLSNVDIFFPVSDYTANLLLEHGIAEKRIEIVINGTDPAKFYPKNTQYARAGLNLKATKVLLTISRLVSRKGIDTALKAFKLVLKKHPDSKYIIIGDGPYKKNLQYLSRELNVANSVNFAGSVSYNMLIEYYNACNVFVMPSKTEIPNVEGFGIVFLEANACGKPVIGTYSGGIPSAVVNGKTGLLVEEQQPVKLARAIDKLFSNRKLAAKMGSEGRKRVLNEANWDITSAKLINHIINKI